MIEAVVENSNIITHIEPMLRIFIIKDMAKLDIFSKYSDDKDMFDIYDELGLSRIETMVDVISKEEYNRLLDLCYKRYDERYNPINNMQIDDKTMTFVCGRLGLSSENTCRL